MSERQTRLWKQHKDSYSPNLLLSLIYNSINLFTCKHTPWYMVYALPGFRMWTLLWHSAISIQFQILEVGFNYLILNGD